MTRDQLSRRSGCQLDVDPTSAATTFISRGRSENVQ
jgi:hypothetical protein